MENGKKYFFGDECKMKLYSNARGYVKNKKLCKKKQCNWWWMRNSVWQYQKRY